MVGQAPRVKGRPLLDSLYDDRHDCGVEESPVSLVGPACAGARCGSRFDIRGGL
jgi:hypothetical protein